MGSLDLSGELEDAVRCRQVFERLDLPVVVLNSAGIVLFANDALASMLGVQREISAVTSRLEATSLLRELRSLVDGNGDGGVYDDLLPGPHGTTHVRWHSIVLRAESGGTVVASVGEDLSEETRVAATLHEVERVAEVGHWVWDIELGQLSWSDAVFGIFGVDRAGFFPTYAAFLARVHKDDRALITDGVATALRDEKPYDVQHRILRPDGEVRFVRERAEVRRRVDGTATRMIGTVKDVTAIVAAQEALRAREEQLRHSQKMEALGALAGGIAHDFNNMLSVILGFSSLLSEDDLPSEVAQSVTQIRKAAERAHRLTKQLLAFSRQQVVHPVCTDLAAVAIDFGVIAHRLLGEHIEWVLRIDATPRVNVDPVQMEQLLLNLAINARDAMPGGGTLTCSLNAEIVDERHRCADEVPPGEYAVLALTDTGTGIDPAVRERMFEPFVTTKPRGRGTGLGLAMVYGIVQQSRGRICVDSALGEGTTFTVYLPIHRGEPTPIAPPRRFAAPPSRDPVVLVVEDEDDVRAVTCAILRRHGYVVLEAASAAAALAALAKTRADLLLVDVVMPEMSGPELARRCAALYPDLPVLFITGYTDDITFHHGVQQGAVRVVNKPLAAEDLVAAVHAALEAAPEPTENR
ncbi:MAG: response regulator [Deltaproteobacteria bacterium]|nr:response regulator [Deltaproteobacteria bacterium]